MENFLVFANGSYNNKDFYINLIKENPDYKIIAIDGGINFLNSIYIKPDIFFGDFDSSVEFEDKEIEVFKFIKEKDFTDTEYALDYLVKKGAKKIKLLGMLSDTRIDHSLANIFLIENYLDKNINIEILNENNQLKVFKGPNSIELNQFKNYTVSIIPLSKKVKDFTLIGFKYSLNNKELFQKKACFTISNKIISDKAKIEFKKGIILIDFVTKEI